MKFVWTVVLCSAPVLLLYAQRKDVPGLTSPVNETLMFADTARYFERTLEIGLLGGITHYFGDLTPENGIQSDFFKPAGGFFVRRHLWPMLAIRANVLGGQLYADESVYADPSWRKDRAYNFNTTFAELSLQAEIDLFGFFRYRHKDEVTYTLDLYTQTAVVNRFRRTFSPYLFGGGGLLMTDAKTNFNLVFSEMEGSLDRVETDLANANGWKQQGCVFGGGGFTFDIGYRWVLGAEAGIRKPIGDFEDLLDGVSSAGNPDNEDAILVGGLTLSYRIGRMDRDGDGVLDQQDKCPTIPGRGISEGCPDADNDEVADRVDECPHLVGHYALSGCPIKDRDEDGVPDVDDACPEVAGLAFFAGCPDTDGDGVENRQDTCPTVFGEAWFAGCPDTDCDSMPDALDACPRDSGVVFLQGCPIRDTDMDGIADHVDECPNQFGDPAYSGCADTDCDGVEDRLDRCPTQVGDLANKGCPQISKTDQKKLDLAVKNVQFETGNDQLKASSDKTMMELADILTRYSAYHVRIEGHTDNAGDDAKNLDLSQRRAQACVNDLIKKGIATERMRATGYGETKPVTPNSTSAGRAKNRRVEFKLYLPEQAVKLQMTAKSPPEIIEQKQR